MTEKRLIFGIFEGGGAKGIAHVGALAAVQANGLEFAGVAGASAGAIVATLIAAGLSSKDILDPMSAGSNILARYGTTPTGVLGGEAWKNFGYFRRGVHRFGEGLLYGGFAFGTLVSWRTAKVVRGMRERRGHFSTAGVRDLVNRVLRDCLLDAYADAGLPKSSVPARILFKHLDYEKFPIFRPLKIVATDLGQHALTVFDQASTPDVEIAEAVAASVAIPLIFEPVTITSYPKPFTGPFVDGGLISNSPTWVFAEEKLAVERANPMKPPVPIVSFTLVEEPKTQPDANGDGANSVGDFLANLARTAIFGSQAVSQRFIEDVLIVPLTTKLDLLAFDAPWLTIAEAHAQARRDAAERLKYSLTLRPDRVRTELQKAHDEICGEINRLRAQRGVTALPHLRANLIESFGAFSFRVTSAFNMDGDADDRLSLDVRARGAPEAFRTRSLILMGAPLATGTATPSYMTKYERALVRSSLRSAICVPVFREIEAWERPPPDRPEPIGVFCLDSDEDLAGEFGDRIIRSMLVERSSVLSFVFEQR